MITIDQRLAAIDRQRQKAREQYELRLAELADYERHILGLKPIQRSPQESK